MRRRTFLSSVGGGLAGGSHLPALAALRPVSAPLKIAKVEAFIARYPNDAVRDDELLNMPPLGGATRGSGMERRLDHHSPSRSGRYQQFLLVKISTSDGLYGWGEGHAPAAPRVHQTVVTDMLKPVLMGQDARRIGPLWEKMYSTQRLRGYSTGFYTEAIAAVDIALWDLLGKATKLPVYRLLGGKYRERIPTYLWIRGATAEECSASARAALADGYTVVKMGLNARPQIELVSAACDAMRGKGQVIVDSLGAFRVNEAIAAGKQLDRLGNIGWWEDPLMPEDSSGYETLADAIDTPLCVGEVLSNRFQLRDLCAARAIDVTNIDVCRAGGITESRRMAVLADAWGMLWSPHVSMGSAPYIAASLHLAAATPNCLALENNNSIRGPLGNVLLQQPIEYGPGYARLPEGPGLGIDFNEKGLRQILVT